jgi:hypothetical protein
MKTIRTYLVTGLLFCLVLAVPGCSRARSTFSMTLSGYNHSESEVGDFIVTSVNAKTEGGYLRAGTGGGSMTCCVQLPRKWEDGLTVVITQYTHDGKSLKSVDRIVNVPKYDSTTAGTFNVHFLHDGSIKVFATHMVLGNRYYPLTGMEARLKPGEPVEFIN